MEEIELRDALLRHVSTAEPPMRLSAVELLHSGRRRARWRLGAVVTCASAATALALVGGATLIPAGGRMPWLADDGCSLPLANQPYPISLPLGSPSPGGSGYPAPEASYATPELPHSPTPNVTYPTPEGTSEPEVSHEAEPTSLTITASKEVVLPTSMRTGQPAGDPALMEALQCHLTGTLKALLPDATYGPSSDHAPMAVYPTWTSVEPYAEVTYCADTLIVHDGQVGHLEVRVEPGAAGPVPGEAQDGWTRQTINTVAVAYLSQGRMVIMYAYLSHSTVRLSLLGNVLTPQQLASLIKEPELDMHR